MKFTLVISFGLLFAYLAEKIGLAPIVGAFAAGLVLDPIHFKHFQDPTICDDIKSAISEVDKKTQNRVMQTVNHHAEKHIEDLLEPLGHFLVPIFFVMTGFNVDLTTFTNKTIILLALGVTLTAFIGKILAGIAAGKANKWIIGWGMVPRGEVGLIFATIGRQLGVINNEVFSMIVIMVILTTLIPPIVLSYLIKKSQSQTPPVHP